MVDAFLFIEPDLQVPAGNPFVKNLEGAGFVPAEQYQFVLLESKDSPAGLAFGDEQARYESLRTGAGILAVRLAARSCFRGTAMAPR